MPGTSHIGDLVGFTLNNKNTWQVQVWITVHDSNRILFEGATVTGVRSGGFVGNAACKSNFIGVCMVTSGSMAKNTRSTTLTINSVSYEAYICDLGSNLVSKDLVSGKRWQELTERVSQVLDWIRQARAWFRKKSGLDYRYWGKYCILWD